jgi:hypothetical protein
MLIQAAWMRQRTNSHRGPTSSGAAIMLVLVRSVYTCTAIYQQFFVP